MQYLYDLILNIIKYLFHLILIQYGINTMLYLILYCYYNIISIVYFEFKKYKKYSLAK